MQNISWLYFQMLNFWQLGIMSMNKILKVCWFLAIIVTNFNPLLKKLHNCTDANDGMEASELQFSEDVQSEEFMERLWAYKRIKYMLANDYCVAEGIFSTNTNSLVPNFFPIVN